MADKKPGGGRIVTNRKARHEYFLEERIEAGLVLEGWEVKSLRAGKVQLVDSYVLLKDGEAFLLGAHILPLPTASTHKVIDPERTRKLLLHRRELARLFAATNQDGFTCIATALYWKGQNVKCEIALAKGKKQYDKRAVERDRDWNREKRRIMKESA